MSNTSNSSITSSHDVKDIVFSGDDNEFIHLGKNKYLKSEIQEAFGGTLNPGASPYPVNKFGNPAPLGLAAFAMTTFILSMFNSKAMGITIPNVVVSLACMYGGAVQFLAGVWELAIGNTFGGTALTSYGAFWLSYAAIFIESFGIASAYEDAVMFDNAVGFYLIGWAIVTFMFVLTTSKSTLMFFLLFLFLCITFILLGAGALSGVANVSRAGGIFGVITAFLGWYNAFAGVAVPANSYITARPIPLPRGKLE